jgi:hypothetical protein
MRPTRCWQWRGSVYARGNKAGITTEWSKVSVLPDDLAPIQVLAIASPEQEFIHPVMSVSIFVSRFTID